MESIDYSVFLNVVIIVLCNSYGYMLKNFSIFKRVNNNDISALLVLIGGVHGVLMFGISLQSFAIGFVSGLASLGIYDGFVKKFTGGKE